jgi:diguanylate cyclase (GGDEF)-like protein
MSQRSAPAIRPEEIAALKATLETHLHEDPINVQWLIDKVDRLQWSSGRGLHAGVMLMLFNVPLPEDEARRQWQAILAHRAAMEKSLGRPVALRTAAVDHLISGNRRMVHPYPLEVLAAHRPEGRALTDALTGLHTAAFLEDQLAREVGRARRYELDLSLVHMEIDEFAAMQERLGATMGTVLLQEVARIVAGCIRSMDYAARIGSSAFCMLLTETDRMGAYQLAERIRLKAEAFYLERRIGGRPFEVTLSAGVAAFPQDADDAASLSRSAREAYHIAQSRGRNRVTIHHRERREFIRLDLAHQDLEVSLAPEGEPRQAEAALRNISSGGVLFESAAPVELGRTVHVICHSRKAGDQVIIPGRVVRVERFDADGASRYEIGVLFDLVVEEQLEGVVDFLERFIAAPPSDPPGAA